MSLEAVLQVGCAETSCMHSSSLRICDNIDRSQICGGNKAYDVYCHHLGGRKGSNAQRVKKISLLDRSLD